jgi:hypothetical protein
MPYSDAASKCDEETRYRDGSCAQYRAANCRQHPAIPLTQRQENPDSHQANQHPNRACAVIERISIVNVCQHSPEHISVRPISAGRTAHGSSIPIPPNISAITT